MNFHRTLLPITLVAFVVIFGGCTRTQARRDSARDLRSIPSQPSKELAREPIASPTPPVPPPLPKPPAEPPVAPPQADTLSGNIPPMPSGGPTSVASVPLAVPDSPVVQAAAAEPESDADKEKRKQRREDRKERRDQRREDRENPPSSTPPATQTPSTEKPKDSAPPPATANDSGDTARKLVEASAKRYAEIPDFECRLKKHEVVKGKTLPWDEVEYRFRQKPLSVYMKTLSEDGQGREVMYVQGQFGNQIHLITGKGDNRLVGAGFKTSMDPDDSRATAKSRHRIYEAGLGRTITGLQKALESQGRKGGCEVKSLGQVKRSEYPYPLDGVEMRTNNAGSDILPGGGTKQVFFDTKPDSPSYMLPVVIITNDLSGKEVEYYSFTRFKVPAGTTDADWNPSRLGK